MAIKVVQNFSIFDRLLYGLLWIVSFPIAYLSLIPFYIKNGSFNNNENSKDTAIILEEKETEITFINSKCKEEFIDELEGFTNIVQILKYSSLKYPNNNHLGTRKVLESRKFPDPVTKKPMHQYRLSPYYWKTYKETYSIVEKLAYGFQNIGLNKENRIAMFADTSEEWFLTFFASLMTNSEVATIYSTLYDHSICHALNMTQVVHIFVDEKSVSRLISNIVNIPSIKNIIISESVVKNDLMKDLKKINNDANIYTLQELLEIGQEKMDKKETAPFYIPVLEDTAVIMYTSGSTGIPKGVIIKNKNIIAIVASFTVNRQIWADVVFPAFLPLSHIFELCSELVCTYYGRSIGYCRPLTLTDKSPMIIPGSQGDLTVLKPTVIIFVPSLVDRISKSVINAVNSQPRIKQVMFQFFCDYKTHFIKLGHETPVVDKTIFKQVRENLGGLIRFSICAGGYLSEDLYLFAFVVLGINISQGYGLTETCCMGTLKELGSKYFYSIGSPSVCTKLKLVNWDEGGYSIDNKPHPRGEIAIQGKSVVTGYINLPDETDAAFKKDRDTGKVWFYTGDICELLPNGHLKIIDRKKDIVKLQHGEYVSLINIETRISSSIYVDQVCVLPNHNFEILIVFVVPNRKCALDYLEKIGIKVVDVEDHIFDKKLTEKILEDIKKILVGLNKFEMPSKFQIVKEIWSIDNNLLTPSLKIKRPEINNYYKGFL